MKPLPLFLLPARQKYHFLQPEKIPVCMTGFPCGLPVPETLV
jgi:hypothetical protein